MGVKVKFKIITITVIGSTEVSTSMNLDLITYKTVILSLVRFAYRQLAGLHSAGYFLIFLLMGRSLLYCDDENPFSMNFMQKKSSQKKSVFYWNPVPLISFK